MFHNHCAMHMLHYIAALRIICLGSYFKKIPARKIPTSGVDVPDPPGVLSIIQPETIVVVNIRSKKHQMQGH